MSRLNLTLFGTPRIEIDSQAVHIARRKATALLAYLALTGVRHNRDSLATLLWPEKGQSRARAELRRSLYFINQAVGKDWLETNLESIGLNPELNTSSGAALWLDVIEFQQQLKSCEKHDHSPTEVCPDCIPHLEAAVDLYPDHFMAGFSLPDCPEFDEWQFFQDEGLRSQLASALLRLSSFYSSASRQDFETAIQYARRWLTLDPLHEPAHQQLMTLFVQSGQRVKAIQQYQECAHILEKELGIGPSKETRTLYKRIQTDEDFPENHRIRRELLEIPRQPGSAIPKTLQADQPDRITLPDKDFQQIENFIGIFQQICIGLERLHTENIVHGNLRPEHITITMDGTVVLTGFGLGESGNEKILLDRELNQIAYLAPEQVTGQKIDFRTDLYALGVMLYEISTKGERPFLAKDRVKLVSQILHTPLTPPRLKNPDIAPGLEKLIIRLLRKDPADRFTSTREVRQILQNPTLLLYEYEQPAKYSLLDRIVRGQIVGRQAELMHTQALWQDTLTSAGQTVLIGGEPGVGKTRLMREVIAQVVAGGGTALVGACYTQGNDSYEAFQQIIRQGFRRYPDLHEGLPGYVMGELIRLAPNLSNHYPDFPENPPLEPNAQQRRLVESMVSFCQTLSLRSPLLLVVEDLHWADRDTLALFQTLARRTHPKRIMLLGTYRDTEIGADHPFNQVLVGLNRERLATRLKLSRLNQEQTGEMLTALFAEETTSEFLSGIYLETEGNPFFVEEVCKALIENGLLIFERGKWQRPATHNLLIPQSVRKAIQFRVGKLDKQAQDVLTLAAIQGREFDFASLSIASQTVEDGLIEALENAERAQLIEETNSEHGGSFTFSHALIPAALKEGLSGLRRRKLHRQVALAVQEIHPEAYQRLAYHWGAGGDVAKELNYTVKAAEQARERYAIQDAIRLYSSALALLPDDHEKCFDLLTARADAYDIVADREAQLADIKTMLRLAESEANETRQIDALLAQAKLFIEVDKYKVKVPAEKALELSRKTGDIAREARASFLVCWQRWIFVEIIPAQQYLENAIALARSAGLRRELAEYLSFSTIAFNTDDDDKRLAAQLEAVAISQEIGDKRFEIMVTQDLAELYCKIKKPIQALPIAEAVLQLSTEVGDIDCRLNALYSLGSTKLHLGLLEEAEAHCLEILQDPYIFRSNLYIYVIQVIVHVYLDMGEYEKNLNLTASLLEKAYQQDAGDYWISELQYFHGIHFRVLGKYRDAMTEQDKSVSYYEKADELGQFAVGLSIMARDEATLGNFDLAHYYLNQAFMYCSGLKESQNYAFVLLVSSEVALLDGSPEAVKLGLRQYSIALELFRKINFTIWSIHFVTAGLLMAMVPEDPSYAPEALGSIEKAISVYEENRFGFLSHPPEYLFIVASQVYRANQQIDKANEYLNKAYARVMLAAGNIKDDDLRLSFLENVPRNRQILAEAKAHGIAP